MGFGGVCIVVVCILNALHAKEVPRMSRPEIRNVMGSFLNHPGLRFQPRPDDKSTLIRFNKARPSTFEPYYQSLLAALSPYENENLKFPEQLYDCAAYMSYRPPETWDHACRFDPIELGPDCVRQQAFGYEDGQPCVLFNLERIYRWLPMPYDNSSVPEEIRDMWSEYSITLKCEGAGPTSRDNMGHVTYYPPHGFHFRYFPDLDQPAWMSPLVFVRFDNPSPAVLLRVECKIYASNIWHSHILDTGVVSFELLVD